MDSCTSTTPLAIISKAKISDTGIGPDERSARLHSLPFLVDHTGTASVEKFFHPERLNDLYKAATFRGHLLFGETVNLPEDYVFCVARNEVKQREQQQDEVKSTVIESTATSLDVWEYDEHPTNGKNCVQKTLVILNLAKDLAS